MFKKLESVWIVFSIKLLLAHIHLTPECTDTSCKACNTAVGTCDASQCIDGYGFISPTCTRKY